MTAGRLPLPILRGSYAHMTRTEKRIADYVSAHLSEVMDQTISTLASEVGTSEITISRFCKKLGFSGLQSFKIALAAELHTQGPEENCDIALGDTTAAVVEKVFRNIADGLRDTLRLLDSSAMQSAAARIRGARRIALCGFGSSAVVCHDIETRFLRFGIAAQACSDAHQQAAAVSLLGPEDVMIAVSHTGTTAELLDTVRTARAAGAAVIVITSRAHAPLAKLGTIVLHGGGRAAPYNAEAVPSRLVHMAIVDALCTLIAMQRAEEESGGREK